MAGNAKYSAEVVVGITANGDAVFFDVVDMTPASFEIKKAESSTAATTQDAIGDIHEDSTSEIISQSGENVNNNLQSGSNSLSTIDAPIAPYSTAAQDMRLEDIGPVGDVVNNSQTKQPKTIVLDRHSELYRAVKESGRSPSAVIREHIIQHFVGKQIKFRDGRIAIVDKTDAKELSKRAGEVKTAEIAQLQEIIDNAILYKADVSVDHKKFKSFSYYKATVELDGKPIDILLNVGFGKFDGKEHLYAITDFDEKRAIAETMSLAGSEDDLLISDNSTNSIPDSAGIVNNNNPLANTDIAPVATQSQAVDEDIAPVAEQYAAKGEPEKIAEIRVGEQPKAKKNTRGLKSFVKEMILDKGMVFEDLYRPFHCERNSVAICRKLCYACREEHRRSMAYGR